MRGPEPMPEATFGFRIVKAEIKKAAGEGKEPYINIGLKCTDDGEHLGRYVWDMVTLSTKPGARFKLKNLLEEGLGYSPEQEFSDTDELLEQEVIAAITVEKGQHGYPDRNKVVKYLSR